MVYALAQSRFPWSAVTGVTVALALGVIAAQAPLPVAAGLLGGACIVVLLLLEPALGIVLMLGLAPLKTLIATESPVAMPVDVGQLGLAAVVAAWSGWRVTQRRHTSLPASRVYLPLAGIMLVFGLSLFVATSPGAWLSEMVKWGEMLVLVLIVLDIGQHGRWEWVALGAVLAGVLQALIGLYEFMGGSGAPHLWVLGYQRFRAFGTFGQPNPYSAFMGLTLPLALGLAWGYGMRWFGRWREHRHDAAAWLSPLLASALYAGAGLVLLGGLLASWGRGAWLGFAAAITVMVFFAPAKRWKGALLFGLGCLLALAMWLGGFVPVGIQQRIDNTLNEFVGFGDMRGVPISNENFAIVERLAHWQAAVNMADAHPFLGVGVGNYEAVYATYGIPSWPRALGHAHNDYLNLLAETGIIGLAAYLIGWAAIVAWTIGALRQPDPVMRGLALGLLGVWTHLAVHSLVDKLYVNNIFLHIGAMLGLLAIAYRYHQQSLVGHQNDHVTTI